MPEIKCLVIKPTSCFYL